MPELPEVETMVRGLRPVLEGATVRGTEVIDPFLLRDTTAEAIDLAFAGAPISEVRRRGKWVLVLSKRGPVLVIEPRMTGGFRIVEHDRPDHIRFRFLIDRPPGGVSFCDTRRLGRIRLFPDFGTASAKIAESLAEDALEIDCGLLSSRLSRTGRPIKPALMDQKIVAGIGNIYADEILYEARVHPERPASKLKKKDFEAIHAAIGRVLKVAIEAEGSSFDVDYRTVMGGEGGFLAINAMYGHEGEPCPACGTPVKKVRIAGLANRPTHYCPVCQKAPGQKSGRVIPKPK
ncbi:DNA-formamidopyrimidine glycosylase [bacterium]|nr:DNA-formamidopyrimidine glycosylase [bacterium]